MENMDMNSMSGNNSMSTSGMTFSNWNDYKLQILFSTWNNQTQWEFALSWFAVALAAIFYQYLDCTLHALDYGIQKFLRKTNESSTENIYDVDNESEIDINRPIGWNSVKIVRGFVAALKYGLSLMLMIIAMTLNPSIFLAIVVGYWIGDIIFCDFKLNLELNKYKPIHYHNNIIKTLLNFVLCMPISHQNTYHTNNIIAENTSSKFYKILAILPRVSSLVYLVLLLVWIVNVEGGFGYQEVSIFGWHALLMSFFIALFTNEAILTYKAPLLPQFANNTIILRYYHAACHIFSMVCIILGLVAIVDYKTWSVTPDSPNVVYPFYTMYSPHSWLGIITVALFGIQIFFSIYLFYLKSWNFNENLKQNLKEIHHFVGYIMYATGLATCITGFQDMQSSDLATSSPAQMIMNNGTMIDMPAMGYTYNSISARLSSAASIMLFVLGVTTFLALKFLPKLSNPYFNSNSSKDLPNQFYVGKVHGVSLSTVKSDS